MWRRREEEERWRLRGPLLFLLLLFCSWLAVAGDADTCHNILVDLCVGLYETSGLVVRRSHYVFFSHQVVVGRSDLCGVSTNQTYPSKTLTNQKYRFVELGACGRAVPFLYREECPPIKSTVKIVDQWERSVCRPWSLWWGGTLSKEGFPPIKSILQIRCPIRKVG